jgi:putative nucleotidyltransferase with HDIG domain
MKPLTRQLHQEYDEFDFDSDRYWDSGNGAAGCIFIAKDTGRILLPHRSGQVLEPHTWGTWGGKVDEGETPAQAAVREIEEETGYDGEYKLTKLWVFEDPEVGFQYHNYLVIVPMEFHPKLNWETDDAKWVEWGEWPHPLHFGLQALLKNAGTKIKRVVRLIKKKQADILEGDMAPPAIVQQVPSNPAATNNIIDAYIVATTLYGEAGGEGEKGMQAVMNVIMNRAKGDFSKARAICLQRKQFSMWNGVTHPEEKAMDFVKLYRTDNSFKTVIKIVDLAMKGKLPDITHGALFYFNPEKAQPSWAKKMVKTATIGHHEFYKPAPRVKIKSKAKPKAAIKEALESGDAYSVAIRKTGLVGVGVYEYEMQSPFSRIRYRYDPDSKIFFLDSIATSPEHQGKGYAKAILESFFRLIKQYGGALDSDTYTTSGMTKIKPAVELLSKKYGVRLLQGPVDKPEDSGKLWRESDELDTSAWVGAIDNDGHNVRPERVPSAFVRHSPHMKNMMKRWRYFPEIEKLIWTGKPTEQEHEETKALLASKGLIVRRFEVQGDYGSSSESLLMEARSTPKQLVEFLRAQIKGTEWDGKVFAVGGFVRDLLLGKEPKDLDVVISVNQGGKLFTDWLGKKLGIYKEGSNPVIFPTFGTANLRLDGVVWNGIDFSGENIDAVMFRKEQYHDPNSRKPVVQFTPHIEIDAQRRDITFNSLYLDIASGEILDPTGMGKEDLKNGIIRTAIDPTIIYTDDALRMFRAVRFAAQFNFKLSPEIFDGIKKNLHRLGNTSRERVAVELNKILTSKHPDYGFRLLRDTGLLAHIGPELQQMVGMTQNVHHKDDVFDHTLAVIMGTQPELLNRLIALFHDIGKVTTRAVTPKGVQFIGHEDAGPDIVERIMMSLKYPRVMIDAVKLGVRHHMKLKHGGPDAVKLSDKSLRKFKIALGEYLEQLLDVMHADNISHADASAMPKQLEAVRARLKALDIQVTKPVLPINGNDLLALGIKPGPMVGKILNAVTEKWYENPNVSREEAMHIAKSILNGST